MSARSVRGVVATFGALAIVAATATPAAAYGGSIDVKVGKWSSDRGHGYVAVTAEGRWAPPPRQGRPPATKYWSEWENMGNPGANCHAWWVTIHLTSDNSPVNPDNPLSFTSCGPAQPVGLTAFANGDMSMYVSVAVDPVTGPANQPRDVITELTAGWRDALEGALEAYVQRSSVRVNSWTIDFGDGQSGTFPANGPIPDRLVTPHTYAAGSFDIVATAHVSGTAYAAFFTPGGDPVEQAVPFSLDISNVASGVSALPVEYIEPVVTVGATPSGSLPGGAAVEPSATPIDAFFWPRGLPCALYPLPIIEAEGFTRSGGVRIGGAKTRLTGYRLKAGVNDAAKPTRPGHYAPDAPIAIQWDTPLPGKGTYPVRLVLELETTYDDGTVRTSEATGTVAVTVVYSAVSQ